MEPDNAENEPATPNNVGELFMPIPTFPSELIIIELKVEDKPWGNTKLDVEITLETTLPTDNDVNPVIEAVVKFVNDKLLNPVKELVEITLLITFPTDNVVKPESEDVVRFVIIILPVVILVENTPPLTVNACDAVVVLIPTLPLPLSGFK